MNIVIGSCSLCGGDVVGPHSWCGVGASPTGMAPVRCADCCARPAPPERPVIRMSQEPSPTLVEVQALHDAFLRARARTNEVSQEQRHD